MKNSFCCLVSLGLIVMLAVIGCVSEVGATPVIGSTQPKTAPPEKGITREDDWNKTIVEARQEGELSIYKATVYFNRAAARFKQEYGINISLLTLNSGQIAERMSREYRAGIYNVDVISTGFGGVRLLKPMGLLAPLDDVIVLPEVLDPEKWVFGKLPLFERHQVDFFGKVSSSVWRNTELVGENEIREYKDLLNPKYKGKIIFDDPQNSGAGTVWFRLYYPILGEDYMKALVQQEPVVMRDKRLEVEWLARGKYSILLGANLENAVEFRRAGAPIQSVETKEGEYSGPGSGIIEMPTKPPHPNAARLFINWILTKEGQTLLSEENLIPSLRVDVPTGHLDPDVVPKRGKAYLTDDYSPEATEKANEYMRLSARIFAAILK